MTYPGRIASTWDRAAGNRELSPFSMCLGIPRPENRELSHFPRMTLS